MDDLDHSMRIADFDWNCFYDESEECDLLRPSLAFPDNTCLSDSEDSENLCSVCSAGQLGIQQSLSVNSDENSTAGCSAGEESFVKLSVKLNEGGAGGGGEAGEDAVDSEISLDRPAGNTLIAKDAQEKTADVTEETSDSITNTPQTIHSQELNKEDGDLETARDETRNECESLSVTQMPPNMNEPPPAADRAAGEDAGGVASSPSAPHPRAEKERWFVTVNDGFVRERPRAAPVKKKRRQKKTCKNSGQACGPKQEKQTENGPTSEVNTEKNECEGGGDHYSLTQLNQNSKEEIHPESISDSLKFPCEGHGVSEKPVTFDLLEEKASEPTRGSNKRKTEIPASPSRDTFSPRDPSQVESAESEGFEEFLSVHSYDSECYLSAAESVEDTQHLVMENLRPVDFTQPSAQGTPAPDAAATSCGVHDVELTPTSPPAGLQRANETPGDDYACDNNAHSTLPHAPSDTPEQKVAGGASGDQLTPPPVPSLTPTPCSEADSPEKYAEAAGHTRPVYAISAFWDEMEKLTINDILQLRVGRGPAETDAVAANEDESTTSPNSLADPVECNSSDGGLMDASDAADSDYFTQPDESKPDRSSCEFSTSDFEEEYWQFISTSGDHSPDPHSKHRQRTRTLSLEEEEEEEEEEESMSSDGKETPVPLEDSTGRWVEDQESQVLVQLEWPRQMTKSKSLHNVRALNKDDITLPFRDNGGSLFLSSCESLEDSVVLEIHDSLRTLTPPPFLSSTHALGDHYQISFPEVFEYFFTEDNAKTDSRCVAMYDPGEVATAPVFDYTLCTFRDEMSFFSQCREEKPIPIFSCSHPTVRELTFPKPDYVFLSADRAAAGEADDLSPIRVVSHSLIQASRCGVSAAAAGGRWASLLPMRKIHFHNKGSISCSRSGAWVFPVEAQMTENKEQPVTVLTEGTVSLAPAQWPRQVAVQQSILGTIHATRRDGIFSTLKQSDMCLVCIAFASWVLRSSDPESADAWKAALLANVSALSAIQYLRQYVKKRTAPQDDP